MFVLYPPAKKEKKKKKRGMAGESTFALSDSYLLPSSSRVYLLQTRFFEARQNISKL
jgi:hypothetical protein